MERIGKRLGEIDNFGDFSYIKTIIKYCFVVGEVTDEKKLKEVIQNELNQSKEKIMSYAEQLMNRGYRDGVLAGIVQGLLKGKLEGKEEGKAEGEAMTAERMIFGLLKQNVDPQIIAKSAGLSLAKILEFKKQFQI